MQISIGADERHPVVDFIITELAKSEHELILHLPEPGQTLSWSNTALQVAEDVVTGQAVEGILLCWTGTGMSIAANKVPGIRAALCDDAQTAKGARLWNNANVLCLSMRKLSNAIAKEILQSWLTNFYLPNPSDDECLAVINTIEKKYAK